MLKLFFLGLLWLESVSIYNSDKLFVTLCVKFLNVFRVIPRQDDDETMEEAVMANPHSLSLTG